MKHSTLNQNQKNTSAPKSTPAADFAQCEADFVPSPDEVARRAYFNFESQGSVPGHDVQHWLKAEADLLAERNLTRVHGFHNRT